MVFILTYQKNWYIIFKNIRSEHMENNNEPEYVAKKAHGKP